MYDLSHCRQVAARLSKSVTIIGVEPIKGLLYKPKKLVYNGAVL